MLGGIIGSIIAGAIIGFLGRAILPGKQNMSLPITIGIGVLAGIVASLVLGAVGYTGGGGIRWIYWIVSAALAAAGIVGYSAITKKN